MTHTVVLGLLGLESQWYIVPLQLIMQIWLISPNFNVQHMGIHASMHHSNAT